MKGNEKQLAELIKGSSVWVEDKNVKGEWPWIPGKLTTDPAPDGYQVKLDNGQTVVVQSCEAANPAMQEGVNDLMQLTHLNEPSLLHNMQTRFDKDVIYTLAGTVLIAVNPFKKLDIYDNATQDKYRGAAASARLSSTSSFGSMNDPTELPPHIYRVAGDAFRSMERDGRSQSIVISGESGSGKTESTKHALKYLANLSNKIKGGSDGESYEQKLLETNPILEAFGNAKTVRNDNSSRFGKLIQIHFNHKLHIVGAGMRTYLLEKSRVVRQAPKERGYHIFYQLIAGASPGERQMFHLPPDPATFRYISKDQLTVPGQDDSSNFEEVCQALDTMGFDAEDINSIFTLVAAVLWLGNIEFEEGDNDAANVVPGDAAGHAAELLGVNLEDLIFALTHKTIKGLGTAKNLNHKLAAECRDALAKAVYAGLFDWIVEKINEKLFPGARSTGTHIGILDIFGFENFTENGFEQLCINYANEKLQAQFCRHEFNLRQQEYREELGEGFPRIEYQDNKACIELLEGAGTAPGVFALLDSEARMPGNRTGMQYVTNLLQACKGNDLLVSLRQDRSAFQIAHFSDVVKYKADHMNATNKDDISIDLIELMAGSTNRVLGLLGKKTKVEADGKKGLKTVGARFRQEMKELEAALDATDLHFVRCVKPTDTPTPPRVRFDQKKVMDQLRSAGIITVAQLAKSGYPTRYEISRFVSMYSSLNLKTSTGIRLLSTGMTGWLEAREPTDEDCSQLLQHFGIKTTDFAIGKTKIFFRTGVLGRVEDQYAATKRRLQLLSCTLRRFQWKRWWNVMRRRVVTIQSAYRYKLAQIEFHQLKIEAEKARQAAERAREAAEKELRDRLLVERQKTIMAQLAREARIKALLRLKKEEEAAAVRQQEEERRRREAEEEERLRMETEEQERRREAEELERVRREQEELERERREQEELVAKQKEAEEQERKRIEQEELVRRQKQAEEQERRRREQEELVRRQQEAEEQERKRREQEEAERKRIEAAELQRKMREQEKQVAEEARRKEEEGRKAVELPQQQAEGQQRGRAGPPKQKMKIVPVPKQHREETAKYMEQVQQTGAPGQEHILEVFNSFLDVSRKLGNDLQLLQDVLSNGSNPGFYFDAKFEHSILKQSLARLESRFVKYNLQRAHSMLSRTGEDPSSLANHLHAAETIFRNWMLDMQASLQAMEPYLPDS